MGFGCRFTSHKALTVLMILLFISFGSLLPHLAAQEQLSGDWLRFSLSGRENWGASSVLESEQPWQESRYGPEKAQDGKAETSWVEGASGAGIGESYWFSSDHLPEAFGFINGYAKNRSLFDKNYRVREFELRVFTALSVSGFSTEKVNYYDAVPAGESTTIRLADTMEPQRTELQMDRDELRSRMRELRNSKEIAEWDFPMADEMGIPENADLPIFYRYILVLEIRDVYKGSQWEDTCIAELWADYGEIEEVSVSGDRRSLLVTTDEGKKVPTYRDFTSVLALVEVSGNGKWVIVTKEPAYLEADERPTTSYAVVHAPTGRDITGAIFGTDVDLGLEILPTGFSQEGEETYVHYEDLDSGESSRAPCSLY